MDFHQLHKLRIANEYKLMCGIANNPVFSWVAIKGNAPYIEEYLLVVNVKTYSSPSTLINQCIVRITLPEEYPKQEPIVIMDPPVIFHPNWWENGRWSCGTHKMTESLGQFIKRMIRSIQFDPLVIDPHSSSNREAAQWYLNNKHLFPSDNKNVSIPTFIPKIKE